MDYLDKLLDSAAGAAVALIDNEVKVRTSPQTPTTQVQVVERIIESDGKPAPINKNLMYAGLGIAGAIALFFIFKKSK